MASRPATAMKITLKPTTISFRRARVTVSGSARSSPSSPRTSAREKR